MSLPTAVGVDVLIEVGIDPDGAGVQPGLVSEGTRPDVGLAGVRRNVRDLADGVGDTGRLVEASGAQDLLGPLQLEVGDDADEVGVAGALAVAVDRPLDVHGARVDRREGVRHRTAGVVVTVDAERGGGRGADVVDDLGDPVRKVAAVRVAHRDELGAGVDGRTDDVQGVPTVQHVTVEEVLPVQEDPTPLTDEEADGVRDHREVLLPRRPQRPLDVADVALGHERDDLGTGVHEGPHLRVGLGAASRPSRRAECRQDGVLEPQVLGRPREEVGVLGDRSRPATLDVADPQVVQVLGDGHLVGHGQAQALLLRTVAQGRVVDVEIRRRHASFLIHPRVSRARPYWMSTRALRSADVTGPGLPSP